MVFLLRVYPHWHRSSKRFQMQMFISRTGTTNLLGYNLLKGKTLYRTKSYLRDSRFEFAYWNNPIGNGRNLRIPWLRNCQILPWYMTAKHLEHILNILGLTDEARVTLGLPLPCRTGFAFAIAHMRQRHSAHVLFILKRPGLKSFETFKTCLTSPERHWYNVKRHTPDGKKDSQFHNSK